MKSQSRLAICLILIICEQSVVSYTYSHISLTVFNYLYLFLTFAEAYQL